MLLRGLKVVAAGRTATAAERCETTKVDPTDDTKAKKVSCEKGIDTVALAKRQQERESSVFFSWILRSARLTSVHSGKTESLNGRQGNKKKQGKNFHVFYCCAVQWFNGNVAEWVPSASVVVLLAAEHVGARAHGFKKCDWAKRARGVAAPCHACVANTRKQKIQKHQR